MIPISFGPQLTGDLAAGSAREWLVADGRGGYAMGTVTGLRTRRYHGLLVVAGDTLGSRRLGLASLDPVVTLPSGATVRLATHEWASGAISPAGHAFLESFDLADGLPRWRWRIGDVVLERELAMVHGRPCLAVVHRLRAGGPITLTLDALCTWRDAHAERTAAGPPPATEPVAGGVVVEGAYRLAGPGWQPAGTWWHGVHHREEAARGLAPQEDLWHAGGFTAILDRPGAVAEVVGWADRLDQHPGSAVELVAAARQRRRAIAAAGSDPATGTLRLAADAFIVTGAAGHPDVVAGYPWFGAWSRDTMISYEGLFLATGRADEGRELLRGYAGALSEGMLPNTADTGRLEYNTADGTLWFVHAVDRHVAVTGDTDLAAELRPALAEVIDWHTRGTRYGIGVDPADGLLRQGVPGEALTWMDARVDGEPVTPRRGKAVEINALWVNALRVAGEAARHAAAREAFRSAFRADGGLADVVGDPAVRPNALIAYALPDGPMEPDPAAVRAIGAALLTPLGLRSLAPTEPGYRGAHRGGPASRDRAYHQGTVWPWLIGPYADACQRAGLDTTGLFDGLLAHLTEWGLGSVSETADGDPPHAATGCPFQAWSVAELLRHQSRQ
ncbi:MAG TPA: amylo-alpha-1,6-glucosidase [Natronosporangium sp.]